jgi:protein-tyrosine phosphatase
MAIAVFNFHRRVARRQRRLTARLDRIVSTQASFVDIHCHLLPSIDDGAKSWDESLAMARMAAADGTEIIIATPHQLGSYRHNLGEDIRQRVEQMNALLEQQSIPLKVMPGADVRIEADMLAGLQSGNVVTLSDQRKHVLLELPHEMYFPLEPILQGLERMGLRGILSHPERNQGLLKQQELIGPLVDAGCYMQVTAGSLTGTFGPRCQAFAEQMVTQRQVHFIATDAHGPRARRPLMQRAFERVAELADWEFAEDICCHNPRLVVAGKHVEIPPQQRSKPSIASWFGWRKAA